MDYKKSDKDELIKRIRELERQLEDEQMRSFGLSKMIDIAEDQLKISIRKKSATKQSKR
jgi:translation initiation factor 2B subunit (eIF-2B alpha/beta/delta family)